MAATSVFRFHDPLAVVYHYTTTDTMLKIVQGASIWATSINYLNDKTEGEHFLNIIRERIPVYKDDNPEEDESIFDVVLKNESKGFESLPFVTSFTSDSDSLMHWRSYCPHGNGVAIGFKVDCLERAFVETTGQRIDSPFLKPNFGGVKYLEAGDSDACDAEIRDAIHAAKSVLRQLHDEDKSEGLTLGELFAFVIQRRASFIKHSSFSNEHESRLLVSNTGTRSECLSFRSTRSTLVPYIALSIPRKHSSSALPEGQIISQAVSLYGPDPQVKEAMASLFRGKISGRWDFIDSVVIGPTANESLSLDAAKAVFRKYQMNVQVASSKVPYRDW